MKSLFALSIKPHRLAVMAGLIVAQVIAFGAVRQSNLQVYQDALGMQAAGWFAVPTGAALDRLPTFGAAFAGGLFFTLTSGAALALAAWGMVRLWQMYFPHNRHWCIGPPVAAVISIAFINYRGWVWFPSLLAAAVLLTSGWIAGLSPVPNRPHSRWWVPLAVLALLTGLWATQLNSGLFTTIRDHLLLSNAAGSKINDYYYRNTLYAAEVFKSFKQKSLRTCRLEGKTDPLTQRRLTTLLAGRDVLVIDGQGSVDLTIRLASAPDGPAGDPTDRRSVWLISRNGRRIDTDLAALNADLQHWLNRISDQDDRYAPFRRLTFLGLLIGFPILLYWAVYGLIRQSIGFFVQDRHTATWTAALICLMVGILLFLPLFSGRPAEVEPENIDSVLRNGPWTQRVAAMRMIKKENLDIARYPAYRDLRHPHNATAVERYYLARLIALSRTAATYDDLEAMIDDPHPNVVCQVFYALGRRGHPSAAALIKNRIMQSDHWYIQWYGYQALRNLGWRQKRSVSLQ